MWTPNGFPGLRNEHPQLPSLIGTTDLPHRNWLASSLIESLPAYKLDDCVFVTAL